LAWSGMTRLWCLRRISRRKWRPRISFIGKGRH